MHELVIIETGHIDARFKHEDVFTTYSLYCNTISLLMIIIMIISLSVFVVLSVSGSNAFNKHLNKFFLVHAMKK